MPIRDDGVVVMNGAAAPQVTVGTHVMQTSQLSWKLFLTASNGTFVGEVDILTTDPNALPLFTAAVSSFVNQYAARNSGIVRVGELPPGL